MLVSLGAVLHCQVAERHIMHCWGVACRDSAVLVHGQLHVYRAYIRNGDILPFPSASSPVIIPGCLSVFRRPNSLGCKPLWWVSSAW